MDTSLVGNHYHIFRKIIKSNEAYISKSTNEYYQNIIEKSGHKMDLYPAMRYARFCTLTVLLLFLFVLGRSGGLKID